MTKTLNCREYDGTSYAEQENRTKQNAKKHNAMRDKWTINAAGPETPPKPCGGEATSADAVTTCSVLNWAMEHVPFVRGIYAF